MKRRIVDHNRLGGNQAQREQHELSPLQHGPQGQAQQHGDPEKCQYLDGMRHRHHRTQLAPEHDQQHCQHCRPASQQQLEVDAAFEDAAQRPCEQYQQQNADPEIVDAKIIETETEREVAYRRKGDEQPDCETTRDQNPAVGLRAPPQLRDQQQGQHAHVEHRALEVVHPAGMLVAYAENVLVEHAGDLEEDRDGVVCREQFAQPVAESGLRAGDARAVEHQEYHRQQHRRGEEQAGNALREDRAQPAHDGCARALRGEGRRGKCVCNKDADRNHERAAVGRQCHDKRNHPGIALRVVAGERPQQQRVEYEFGRTRVPLSIGDDIAAKRIGERGHKGDITAHPDGRYESVERRAAGKKLGQIDPDAHLQDMFRAGRDAEQCERIQGREQHRAQTDVERPRTCPVCRVCRVHQHRHELLKGVAADIHKGKKAVAEEVIVKQRKRHGGLQRRQQCPTRVSIAAGQRG